jgi:pentatricopeptide repeat protein
VTLLSSPDDGILKAMRYLEDFCRHGCSPGPKFFRVALQLCLSKSDNRSAIALWKDYIERGVCLPDTAMYNYMIALSCKEKQLEAAMSYFDKMVLHGAFPDPDTYNVLLQVQVTVHNGQLKTILTVHAITRSDRHVLGTVWLYGRIHK